MIPVATSSSNTVTMTSLEMVEFINSQRKEGEAELRHRDFTAKVPKVLGHEISEKLRTSLKDSYGRDQPGYRFPKREACLMAMSYSYETQAKVFDRMTELENAKPVLTSMEMIAAIATHAAQQDKRVIALEDKIKLIEAKVPHEQDYFTIVGYSRYIGETVSNNQALALGRKAAKASRAAGKPIGDTTDPRYGLVHTYHADILDDVFADHFSKAA